MMSIRLALLFPALALCALAAGDDQDQQQKPPTEIPDFSNLDEYIYQPSSTLRFGFRYLTGVKTQFSGNGLIGAPEALPDPTAPDISRTYHDGSVQPDSRAVAVDNGNGITTPVQPPSDGKTNTWNFLEPSQLTSDGFMQFHIYTAQTLDPDIHDKTGKGNLGIELSDSRDIAKIGKHLSLQFFTGFSVNDIQSAMMANVQANVTTVTDTYNLFGVTPGPAPYSSPSSTTQTISDASGSNSTTVTEDTSTLISDAPISRTITSAIDSSEVVDHWKLHGAFATLRAGPSVTYSFNDHLRLTVSAGPALIYAGSSYTVSEVLVAQTGGEIINTIQNTTSRLLFGTYADATIDYDLTDTTGFYLGVYFQNAGGYTQTASADDGSLYGNNGTAAATDSNGDVITSAGNAIGSYQTKVEFNNQEGVSGGLTFRF